MQLSDRELLAALTAIILPLIVAFVQRPDWSNQTRAIVGFVGVLVWTLFGAVYVGDGVPQSVDWHSWIRLFLVNALVSYSSFTHVWKPTGIVQRVEVATSPPSPARDKLAAEAGRMKTPPRTPDL